MPSSSSSGLSGRIIPIIITLSILSIFAFDALLIQLDRNGYSALLNEILDDPNPRFLPGSERLLLRHYTGVPWLDRGFALSNLIWANVVDGSRPELSLFAFCFGAHPIIWGMLMQAFGFGFIMPLFAVVHLLWTSNVTRSQTVYLRDHTSLHTVVPVFLLGYVLLCGLLAFPFPDDNLRQWLNVIWTWFPLHVVVLQTLFAGLVKRMSIGQDTFTPKVKLDREALSYAYGFAWNVAVMGQMCTYAVLIAANMFPGVFPQGVARSLTLERVFIPDAPHTYTPMKDTGSAMHNFFNYDLYIGSISGLIWAVHLLLQVRPELSSGEERTNLARGVATSLLLSGPGGALVALMQHRDDVVLIAEAKADKSQ
ncbi:hypothetical protein LRP88_07284 [Fusarium phalaenopsidis]